MMFNNTFSYVDENSIHAMMRCPICRQPYIDPVYNTNDQTRSCRLCTTSMDIISIKEGVLIEMLNSLLITCNACQMTNLRRGDYPQHRDMHCSKRIVRCKAADLKCSWTGSFEQLDQHLKTCPVEILRPTFIEIFTRFEQNQTRTEHQSATILNEEREQWLRKYEEMKNEAEKFRNERIELQNAIVEISNQFDKLSIHLKQDVLPNNEVTISLNEQIQQNKILEMEIQKMKQLFLRQVTLYNELKLEFERYKQLINSNTDIQQLKEQLDKLNVEIKQYSTNSNDDEINSIKQLLNQHDIQIKLLARKKCVIAVNIMNTDSELEKSIEQFSSTFEITFEGKQIADHNMDVICKKAIIEKRCRKLRLQNNKITGKGASTLSNALCNNTTLIELYLSKNQISDSGVHALAQALSINNSTLKVLDLYSNNITDEGIEYLSEMLKINRTLVRLGLGSNHITDHGVRLLINTIIYFNSTLQWLSFSSNRLITDNSVEIFEELLKSNCSLKTLWLNGCQFSETATKQLINKAKIIEDFDFEI